MEKTKERKKGTKNKWDQVASSFLSGSHLSKKYRALSRVSLSHTGDFFHAQFEISLLYYKIYLETYLSFSRML